MDVVRQALQNAFAVLFKSLQDKCVGWGNGVDAGATQARNYTEVPSSNCGGQCLPSDDSGNCDRMPGCGESDTCNYFV